MPLVPGGVPPSPESFGGGSALEFAQAASKLSPLILTWETSTSLRPPPPIQDPVAV
jgi:hypothetical protein